MIISFPVGAYVVFDSEIGDEINYRYPLQNLDFPIGWIAAPLDLELGDAFIVLWCAYAIVFAISVFGPKKSMFAELGSAMHRGVPASNYMVGMIRWFAILVLASALIYGVQEYLGVDTAPPPFENGLVQFLGVMQAPITEEVGFRLVLIGIPAYLIYSHRASARHLLRSLWHPYRHLHVHENKKIAALIVVVAILFGAGHVVFGESWSGGKFVQATASGLILGWVYFRYGFAPALLIHWAANYFVFSYAFLIADVNSVTVNDAFSHSMMQTIEGIIVLAGCVSVAMMLIRRRVSKKGPRGLAPL